MNRCTFNNLWNSKVQNHINGEVVCSKTRTSNGEWSFAQTCPSSSNLVRSKLEDQSQWRPVVVVKLAVIHQVLHRGHQWLYSSDGGWQRVPGTGSHATTGNVRSPRVHRHVAGTTSVDVSADHTQLRELQLAVSCKVSARYRDTVPWKHRKARTQRRNFILSGTLNQWSLRSSVQHDHWAAITWSSHDCVKWQMDTAQYRQHKTEPLSDVMLLSNVTINIRCFVP